MNNSSAAGAAPFDHKPQRNSLARRQMLAKRRTEQESRTGRFTSMPSKRSLSTRGDRGETWRTKRWTLSRLRDLDELQNPNSALCDRLSDVFDRQHYGLIRHLAENPNDSSANACLSRQRGPGA